VSRRPVTVTQPLLPPLEEFIPYLEQIWENRWLTNSGPFHAQLESALADYLGVKHICLFANGTLALVAALQALRITGEVITTPFSFVATAHSLLWNGVRPVFVDIDPVTFNLDPVKVEAAITPQTTAILGVHIYGQPCDTTALQRIADTYGLKLIYDAAHAFGVQDGGGSILRHGDLSILSFHATKVYNTFEGGAVICPDAKIKQRIDYLKNFGFADEITVVAPGINGKMNEVQAAFGLLQLKHIDRALARRQEIDTSYRQALGTVRGIRCVTFPPDIRRNYAYFPVLVEPDFPLSRDGLYQTLAEHDFHTRRYFYPLISDFPMYRGLSSAQPGNLPRANEAASKVLCLPIYPSLEDSDVHQLLSIIMHLADQALPSPEHSISTSTATTPANRPDAQIFHDRFFSDSGIRRYLYGINEYSEHLARFIDVDGFIDDFTERKTWLGKPVFRLSEIDPDCHVVSCITANFTHSALDKLRQAGIHHIIDYIALADASGGALPQIRAIAQTRIDHREHCADYEWVRRQLFDARSRDTLDRLMAFRLRGDIEAMEAFAYAPQKQYFEPFAWPQEGEVFVDGGGFDGSTSLEFAARCPHFGAIHFFEPSPVALDLAQARLHALDRITYHPVGLYNRATTLRFAGNAGSASHISESGSEEIRVEPLDERLSTPVSFIKLDLEGAEQAALQGMARHILTDHPKLAVAVYHHPSDLWRIPRYILGLRPDYRVYLRHYTEGWAETVMFFVPPTDQGARHAAD